MLGNGPLYCSEVYHNKLSSSGGHLSLAICQVSNCPALFQYSNKRATHSLTNDSNSIKWSRLPPCSSIFSPSNFYASFESAEQTSCSSAINAEDNGFNFPDTYILTCLIASVRRVHCLIFWLLCSRQDIIARILYLIYVVRGVFVGRMLLQRCCLMGFLSLSVVCKLTFKALKVQKISSEKILRWSLHLLLFHISVRCPYLKVPNWNNSKVFKETRYFSDHYNCYFMSIWKGTRKYKSNILGIRDATNIFGRFNLNTFFDRIDYVCHFLYRTTNYFLLIT